jgi:predicted aspartyl protease
VSLPLSLLCCAWSLAGTVEVQTRGGAIVRVGDQIARYDGAPGVARLSLPEGTHEVRVLRLLGPDVTARVEVPATGTVRLVLQGAELTVSGTIAEPTATDAGPPRMPEPPEDAVAIPLGRQGFQLPMRLKDGTVVHAMFDTGATRLGLCPELAEAGGFRPDRVVETLTPDGVVLARTGVLPHVDLLGHRWREVTVSVFPDLACDMVMLGMEQLAHLEAVLRDETLHVWIGEPRATPGSPAFFIDSYGALGVHARVGEQATTLTVDTGAAFVALAPSVVAAAGGRTTGVSVPFTSPTGMGAAERVTLPALEVAGVAFSDVEGVVLEVEGDVGLLGRPVLTDAAVEWRFSRGRASLHAVAEPDEKDEDEPEAAQATP